MALFSGIALPPLSGVGTVGLSKNGDPVTVGCVRTSRCCCPVPPTRLSVLSAGTLLPSSPQLCGTCSLHYPPGLCPLLIASPGRLLWLPAQWQTLWRCKGFVPTASAFSGVCTHPCHLPVGLGSTLTMPHTLTSIGSVCDLPLRRVYTPSDGLHAPDTTSLACALSPTSLSCWLLSPSPS